MRHRLYGGVRGSLCKGALYSILDNPQNIEIIASHSALKGKPALQDIDYTKCDLALIEKCTNVHEKSLKEKPRNYDNFTTAQKVGMAFSALLGPVGPVVAYFAIKAHNKAEKTAFEKQIGQSTEGIQGDLSKLSKETKKLETQTSKSVSFKEPIAEKSEVKQSNTQDEGLKKEAKTLPKELPIDKNNSLITKKSTVNN